MTTGIRVLRYIRTAFACVATLALAAAAVVPASGQVAATPVLPDDAVVRRALAKRVDGDHQAVGIVAGLIDSTGRRVISHGNFGKQDQRRVDGGTVFEIGSITKVFTAVLLASMVERQEVALGDPVSKYLPAIVPVPQRNGHAITLQHLAMHTSGLPENPTNHRPGNMNNPFADYTADKLYRLLATYRLSHDPGATYTYSNVGAGLLGQALANRANSGYEGLLRARVLDPLRLEDTRIALTTQMRSRLAHGHDEKLNPVSNWDGGVLAGAGALRSTADDLLSFLAAAMDAHSTLGAAMTSMLGVRAATGHPAMEVALGWHVLKEPGGDIFFHEGSTGGYEAFVGFDPQARIGVVLLSNAATEAGIFQLGARLLGSRTADGGGRIEISIAPGVLARYVGRYRLTPTMVATISSAATVSSRRRPGSRRFLYSPRASARSSRGWTTSRSRSRSTARVAARRSSSPSAGRRSRRSGSTDALLEIIPVRHGRHRSPRARWSGPPDYPTCAFARAYARGTLDSLRTSDFELLTWIWYRYGDSNPGPVAENHVS